MRRLRRRMAAGAGIHVTTEHRAAAGLAKDTTVRWFLTNEMCIASVQRRFTPVPTGAGCSPSLDAHAPRREGFDMATWARPRVLFAALVLFWPAAAHAQASLAGVVKDASGAVLPGVTVEAASSALIEKVRSVVTDDSGQFKIVDLRPGSYLV